jgi:hypothetical protein
MSSWLRIWIRALSLRTDVVLPGNGDPGHMTFPFAVSLGHVSGGHRIAAAISDCFRRLRAFSLHEAL